MIITELQWTNNKPTETGLYLRNNPVIKVIVKQGVFKMPGCGNQLFTYSNDGMSVKLERIHPSFLWYGPIPTEGLPRWEEDKKGNKDA